MPGVDEDLAAAKIVEDTDPAPRVNDANTPGETYVPRKYESALGFWRFRPNWLQKFSSIKCYVIFYGFFGSSIQSYGAYFFATVSTIEKRFKIPSRTSGIIASSWDVGAMFGSLLLAYFASHGHLTRWIASVGLIAGLSGFMRFLPHALYGPGVESIAYGASRNTTLTEPMCNAELSIEENCDLGTEAAVAVVILCIAHLFLGIGTSAHDTLGVAYLDNNAKKDKVPFYFAMCVAIRMIGPTMGYYLASYFLGIFIDPSVKPPFGRDDPRWMGAWWLGWIPLGTALTIMSLLMMLFPKTLPSEVERRKKDPTRWPSVKPRKSFKDFLGSLKRLVTNRVLMFNSVSTTFFAFGMTAYWLFMPKYIETQFRKSSSEASFVTGSVGLLCTAAGVLVSGSIISIFKPRPTYLAWWNVFTEVLDTAGHVAFAFLSCVKDDLHGSPQVDGRWNLTVGCNADCNCSSRIDYNPVCSSDGSTTFYSACHAGCSSFEIVDSKKMFFNCSCVPETFQALEGACPVDCQSKFVWFLILLCSMQFFAATGRAGNAVIQFRSVLPQDKAISIALMETFLCLLAFIPAPIFFGAVFDSTCLVWGETCGSPGNCWLYHGQVFRYLLNFSASGLLLLGTVCDIVVALSVKNLKIYDEDSDNKDNDDEGNFNPLILMAS